jgi:hypothetical protein
MKKTAGVYTNDKSHPQQDLIISGAVEKFATIRPQHVSLRGYAGDSIKTKVTIIPEKKYPFKILDARAQKGEHINLVLAEVKKSGGQAWELKVENLRKTTGRYYDTIILTTDSKVRPQLNVRVYGYLLERKNEWK